MAMRVLAGYDGSRAAAAAIDTGAALFPGARACIAHLWTPPFGDDAMRRRLWTGPANIDEFVDAVEIEGEREAAWVAATGVTLARAAGWSAEPLVTRMYAGEGIQLAEIGEREDADLIVVGSRGLGGARAVLGSVSDVVVHYAARPVLVVPHPLLSAEAAAVTTGPVLVGADGSEGARAALEAARRLFPARDVLRVTAGADGEPDDDGGSPAVRLRVPAGSGPQGRAIAAALSECARQRAAAALVVGSRGNSAVREILLGSVAMATLHHAHRPVLVVPARARSGPGGD